MSISSKLVIDAHMLSSRGKRMGRWLL